MKRNLFVASIVLAGVGTANAQQAKVVHPVRPALYDPPPVVVDEAPLPPPDVVVVPPPPGALGQAATPAVIDGDCQDCLPCPGTHPRIVRVKCCFQATHWGYPEEFCQRPFGTYTRMAFANQIDNGIAAQLALYRLDFATLDGRPSARLNSTGQIRLIRLAHTIATTPFPLVIEFDQDHPEINESRRQSILAQLRKMNPQVTDEQVVVRIPAAYGLRGEEGIILQRTLLRQTEAGGGSAAAGAAGGSTGTLIQGGSGAQGGMSAPSSASGTARGY